MNPADYFDFCMISIVVIVSFWGILWGFVQALSIVLATGVGMFASARLTHPTCVSLGFSPTGIGSFVIGFLLFALSSMIVYKIMNFFGDLIKKHKLNAWNHILGLVLGFALSLILCWCVAWGMMFFPKSASVAAHSRSAKYLVEFAEFGKEQTAQSAQERTETSGNNPSDPQFYQGFIERVESAEQIPAPELESGASSTESSAEQKSWMHDFLDRLDECLRPILLSAEV